MTTLLGLFARAPQLGKVKSRLAAETSPAFALAVYEWCLREVLERTKSGADRVAVAYTPADSGAVFAALAPHAETVAQCEGDLGERLAAFFNWAFASGADRVIVIGTDSPDVPTVRLAEALDALATHDAVMGPADDGGYWLIGLSRMRVELFERIAWGTGAVAEQTRERCREAGLNLHELTPWYDIDSAADWRRLLDGADAQTIGRMPAEIRRPGTR